MKSIYAKLVLTALVALMLTGCGAPAETPEAAAPAVPAETAAAETAATEPAPTEPEFVRVDMAEVSVELPRIHMSRMSHQKVTEDSVVMEIFSMDAGEEAVELFRIFFGDEARGNLIGYLRTQSGEVPVTMTVCEYPDDFFPDEDSRLAYYDLMDCLNRIVQTLEADPRFHNAEKVPVEKTEAQVIDWKFSIPAAISWEQTVADGACRVDFFTHLMDRRIDLYRFAIGGEPLQTVLGTYLFAGEQQILSVESCPLPSTEGWPEETVTEFYRMMESINDVIRTLMSHEGFAE